MEMQKANRRTRAERDAALVFRMNPKLRTPKTSLRGIHAWDHVETQWCTCGRFHKDDPRLITVALPRVDGLLCKRCIWTDWSTEQRLNTVELPTGPQGKP